LRGKSREFDQQFQAKEPLKIRTTEGFGGYWKSVPEKSFQMKGRENDENQMSRIIYWKLGGPAEKERKKTMECVTIRVCQSWVRNTSVEENK